MLPSKPTSNTTLARYWVLLALLFMLGLQVLETSHHHPASESVSSCVQCHSGTGIALPGNIPVTPIIIAVGIVLVMLRMQVIIPPVLTAHLPRGPPANS